MPGLLDELTRPAAMWDPQLWLRARKDMLHSSGGSDGQGQAQRLWQCIRTSTQRVLEKRSYSIGTRNVALGNPTWTVTRVRWLGHANVGVAPRELEGVTMSGANGSTVGAVPPAPVGGPKSVMVPPPLLVCNSTPLDTCINLRRILGTRRPVVLVAELGEFDSCGGLDLARSSSVRPSCLPLRSDLSLFVAGAGVHLRGAGASMQSHLCARADPYVVLCPGVTVFRGPREEGYPLLADPTQLHVILTALADARPAVQTLDTTSGKTEWYADEAAHAALLERLHLIGLTAINQVGEGGPASGGECGGGGGGRRRAEEETEREDEALRPVLVFGGLGCCGSGPGCQPRHAVANALKHWRRSFAAFFHSVFICCGNDMGAPAGLAALLDRVVNRQVYRLAEPRASLPLLTMAPWHWDPLQIRLCARPGKLEQVGQLCEGQKPGLSDSICSDGAPPPPSAAAVVVPAAVRGGSKVTGGALGRNTTPLPDMVPVSAERAGETCSVAICCPELKQSMRRASLAALRIADAKLLLLNSDGDSDTSSEDSTATSTTGSGIDDDDRCSSGISCCGPGGEGPAAWDPRCCVTPVATGCGGDGAWHIRRPLDKGGQRLSLSPFAWSPATSRRSSSIYEGSAASSRRSSVQSYGGSRRLSLADFGWKPSSSRRSSKPSNQGSENTSRCISLACGSQKSSTSCDVTPGGSRRTSECGSMLCTSLLPTPEVPRKRLLKGRTERPRCTIEPLACAVIPEHDEESLDPMLAIRNERELAEKVGDIDLLRKRESLRTLHKLLQVEQTANMRRRSSIVGFLGEGCVCDVEHSRLPMERREPPSVSTPTQAAAAAAGKWRGAAELTNKAELDLRRQVRERLRKRRHAAGRCAKGAGSLVLSSHAPTPPGLSDGGDDCLDERPRQGLSLAEQLTTGRRMSTFSQLSEKHFVF